jgi:two-component system, NarL family, captular synthesis response regulator RcsB
VEEIIVFNKIMISKSIYNIAFLDDHVIVHSGFQSIFSSYSDIELLFFTNHLDLYRAMELNKIDLLISDIILPEITGIEVIKYTRSHYPDIKIILFSQIFDELTLNEINSIGVNGYILKSDISINIPEIVLQVLDGKEYFSPNFEIFSNKKKLNIKPIEKQLLQLISEGVSMKDAAEKLELTEKVVEYRMRKLRKIFNCKTSIELVYLLKLY